MKTKMKAAILYSPGNLIIEDAEIPELINDDDVLIAVYATGICGSDLGRILVTGTYVMPLIPGHEFCGVVHKTGKNVKGFKVDDRVLVAPILPCYICENCAQGNYGQCDNYNYLGSRSNGGFAEYVVVPSKNLIKMPDSISFVEGAAIEPAAVTLHGMMKIGIQPGDTVVVLGCGTIGLFAVQFAKILGASKIIAVDIFQDKLDYAVMAGAENVINSSCEDAVAEIFKLTNNRGAGIVVETAGSSITQEQSVRMAKKHGKILYLGTAHSDVVFPPKTFENIVRNEITIKGSWNSYSAPFPGAEWRSVVDYLNDGRLVISKYITHIIKLEELLKTIQDMSEKKIRYNKVIVKIR